MQLLVDGRVQPVEIDPIASCVDDAALDADERERLEQLLRMLLDAPPRLEDVVARIVEQRPRGAVAAALVRDLVHVAAIDDVADEREEALLRIVCGALGLEPSSVRGGRGRPLDPRERAELERMILGAAAAA